MDPNDKLLGGIVILILGVFSLILILGWVLRFPVIVKETILAAIGLRASRFGPTVSTPVPDDQEEDYLETRSYA